ncbi:MAG: bifunctional diaminohydroxyphosphoribosylaminopyrimidine deaminase/5-amino-6-(5-phosphoribosylamino)uracil reductase RibD [Ornithinimicrobium sp.]
MSAAVSSAAQVEVDADLLRRCLVAALRGPEANPNPRVGSLILDTDGQVVGVGHHEGAGTPHAEVVALGEAGERARGGTAYVSLEPCAHHGRTPPCAQALWLAGIQRVVYAVADPDARAAGGADWLAGKGVQVDHVPLPEAEAVVRHWVFAARNQRPWVTWKFAATLDGRVAAGDGSSAWVTSAQSRADGHQLRSRCGAIMIGTGTALADDPTLTARRADGSLYADQPLRVVLGRRDLPADARLHAQSTEQVGAVQPPLLLRSDDVSEALSALHTRGVRRVLLEGGPTLSSAMWRAGCVDEVVAYLAPALLGSGATAVGDLGIATMADIARLDIVDVAPIGPDIRITAHPRPSPQQE